MNEDDTQTHRILRRGIPFGNPLRHTQGPHAGEISTPDTPAPPDAVEQNLERGLLFVAYQTSIEDQFEFIIRNWVNNPDFKEPRGAGVPGPVDPATGIRRPVAVKDPKSQGGGHDPIIGQNSAAGEKRIREFTITLPKNPSDNDPRNVAVNTFRVSTADQNGRGRDWVVPTGGGYFFSPSISALREKLGEQRKGMVEGE